LVFSRRSYCSLSITFCRADQDDDTSSGLTMVPSLFVLEFV
jgi:hypothetical protein